MLYISKKLKLVSAKPLIKGAIDDDLTTSNYKENINCQKQTVKIMTLPTSFKDYP